MNEWVIAIAIVVSAFIVGMYIKMAIETMVFKWKEVEEVKSQANVINIQIRAVSTIASILISGALANPKYHEKIEQLRDWAAEPLWPENVLEETDEEEEKREKKIGERGEIFSKTNLLSEGREPYIKQAFAIYNDVLKEEKEKTGLGS